LSAKRKLYGARRFVIESLTPMTSTIPAHKINFIPFVASLLICSFAFNLSADTPQIRVSLVVKGDDEAQMVSALSQELRKLDGVLVTDTQPALKIICLVYHHFMPTRGYGNVSTGYSGSVVVTDADSRLTDHILRADNTIDALAHELVITVDGSDIERIRRAAQPSSSP
jgi:hypothetical protein